MKTIQSLHTVDSKKHLENKMKDRPHMVLLQSGAFIKVLQVTGKEAVVMPEHFCTEEAVLVIQKGSAILKIDEKDWSLTSDQSFIIPAGTCHMLTITEEFQAIVMMSIDSEINFINQ
jgi:quercetin dioxygenase-like cupin family protein